MKNRNNVMYFANIYSEVEKKSVQQFKFEKCHFELC